MKQQRLFEEKVDLINVESVIGSGYEEEVAKLAIEDKIAYRAARKYANTFSYYFKNK